MGYYKNATICKNGHVLSDSNANSQKYCDLCGKETISKCQKCSTLIQGEYEVTDFIDLSPSTYDHPNYCYNCSNPFPWTQLVIDNAVELVALDENLTENNKELIKNIIPDLLIDTPTSPIAQAKYKITMSKATNVVKNAMYNLLVDVISETAKKTIFSSD